MSRAILISINPKPLCNILNGIKTDEIRKSIPKCELPIPVYIYCTKGDYLVQMPDKTHRIYAKKDYRGYKNKHGSEPDFMGFKQNGKVVAKFTLNIINEIECDSEQHLKYCKFACLTQQDFIDYCNGNSLYAWQIDDLQIFDEPKELYEITATYSQYIFHKFCGNNGDGCPDSDCPYYEEPSYEYGEVNYDCQSLRPVTRPPQSWQFLEVEDERTE